VSLRARWLSEREESPLRSLALLPLHPLSWAYGAGAWLHRFAYARGLLRRTRFPGHVVSVGSLLVGGAGKTPLAAWLATSLRARGRRVVLASRGHGGRTREPVTVVSDGRYVYSRVEVAGDEALVLAAHAPGVPVLVGRDRALVGWRAVSGYGADVLVLDDGFQHHRLARQVDIVAFDGSLSLGNRRLLPRGPLREPLGALRRADAIAVVDGPLPPADAALLRRAGPPAHRFEARRVPLGVRALDGGALRPLAEIAGAEVGLLAAIANPAGFRRTLEGIGARVVAERSFPDHHRYRERDLRGLSAAAATWVTTEKDAVKILPAWAAGVALWVLPIGLSVDDPEALLDWVESRLR